MSSAICDHPRRVPEPNGVSDIDNDTRDFSLTVGMRMCCAGMAIVAAIEFYRAIGI
jgi:hypothetical protein